MTASLQRVDAREEKAGRIHARVTRKSHLKRTLFACSACGFEYMPYRTAHHLARAGAATKLNYFVKPRFP